MEAPFYQKWLKSIFGPKDISTPVLKKLGSETDVDLAKGDNEWVPVPQGLNLDEKDTGFLQYWLDTYRVSDEKRQNKYRVYNIMDSNSTEIQLMLDTYRDEALSIGFIQNPLKITYGGPQAEEAEAYVNSVLESAKFFDNLGADIRSIAKYGDIFYHIYTVKDSGGVGVKIRQVDQKDVTAISINQFRSILGYKISDSADLDPGLKQGRVQTGDIVPRVKPWEVAQFTLADNETFPYGKSQLERVRSAFDQLVTMEALYAISRANRVERLVFKIPTGATNPAAAFTKLQQIRAAFKSVILGSGPNNRFTVGKDLGLTDYLFLPSDKGQGGDYDIEKLSSSIDVSSDEDVRYFLEKLIAGSRIPKAYFLADQTTNKENTLSQQDLKFARTLIPLQTSYVQGVVKLCTIIATLRGFLDVQVEASLERPAQVTREQVESYSTQIDAANRYIDSFIGFTRDQTAAPPEGNPDVSEPQIIPAKMKPEVYVKVLMKFGVPEEVAVCFVSPDQVTNNVVAVKASNQDDMYKPLLEDVRKEYQRLKEKMLKESSSSTPWKKVKLNG